MTKAQNNQKKTDAEDRYFVLAMRTGTDFIENASLSATEIPLTILSSLGLSKERTEAARSGAKDFADGIHGSVDSLAEQIIDVVGKQVSLASDAVTSVAKEATKK